MGGTINYVYWRGARLTPWMHYQLMRLDADLYRDWGLHLNVESGIRLHTEQQAIFFDRYTTSPNGRYVYRVNGRQDKRWYLGNWRYRIKPNGTVAVPGTSNHEIRGQDAAVDISDTGDANGITKAHSARGRWLRSRLHLYDMDAEGDSFQEGWHMRMRGIFRTPPATPASTDSKPVIVPEDIMEAIRMAQIRYVHRAEPGYGTEWMIVGMDLPGGYRTTTNERTARGWGAVYGTDKGDSWKALRRDDYIALQQSAAELHRSWVTMQKDIARAAIPTES